VKWAGDWGGSFSRDCQHQDGLGEPITLDDYIRERACMFVDADVYVPGLTDGNGEHPERVLAQVTYAPDGGIAEAAWLSYVGRAGNNYRFRWQIDRQELTHISWTTISYSFRFSTDGQTWFTIGQGDGPDGGAPRTLKRDPSF
jgi:hypothetical protein